jgi:hypothetical protein
MQTILRLVCGGKYGELFSGQVLNGSRGLGMQPAGDNEQEKQGNGLFHMRYISSVHQQFVKGRVKLL